ncbi:DUF4865 domain-containing protein [Streptomyces viridiviolaceus]|uniref:DUF4865 family protein n=1 Tax=Streptomyces viridiviolaceus TaxID=68282 RepID=A0ABW2EDH5_9ACTN|nr:DUF4865 family protein [Streptomyces viridiviolaceus]GHB38764.1 DUF4865 domain-containing protein [Streptomyces viridiviolaceus]
MHAMQYEFTLPADYRMDVIRDRVARTGHLLDDWAGLGLKAYLMRERGVHGSPVSQYAPFYLWNTVEGMNSFLFAGAFQRPTDDFGRPPVRQWTGLAYEEGGAAGSRARVAVRRRRTVPDGVPPAEAAAEAVRETERLAAEDGAVLAAAAVDTSRWELVHFSLHAHDAPKAGGEVFQVLHLSAPGRARLPRGRQW